MLVELGLDPDAAGSRPLLVRGRLGQEGLQQRPGLVVGRREHFTGRLGVLHRDEGPTDHRTKPGSLVRGAALRDLRERPVPDRGVCLGAASERLRDLGEADDRKLPVLGHARTLWSLVLRQTYPAPIGTIRIPTQRGLHHPPD